MVKHDFNVKFMIKDGESVSEPVNIGEMVLGKLVFPAGFTGNQVTFTESDEEGGAYQSVEDGAGNALTYTVGASKNIVLPLEKVYALGPWLKIEALTTGVSEAQTGDQIVKGMRVE